MKTSLNESSRFQLIRTEKTTEKRLLTSSNRATIVCTKRRTTQISCTKYLFPKLGESTGENKALLSFLGVDHLIFDVGGCANPPKNIEHMFLVKKKISCRILKNEKKIQQP